MISQISYDGTQDQDDEEPILDTFWKVSDANGAVWANENPAVGLDWSTTERRFGVFSTHDRESAPSSSVNFSKFRRRKRLPK